MHWKRPKSCIFQRNVPFWKFHFSKKVLFFYQPAEQFPSFSQLGEEEHLFQKSYLHIAFKNLVYLETLSFGRCITTIFHMNKIVFHILCTLIRVFLWGVPFIFPRSCLFWKISQPDEIWWGTPFLRNSSWGALLVCKIVFKLQTRNVLMLVQRLGHLYLLITLTEIVFV